MIDYLQRLLGERGLAPHGYCLLWEPSLIWTHVVSDAIIGLAYFSIPVVIARFLTKRRDVHFSWVVWMFAAFIMACGATHFLSILVLWIPAYGIEALVKMVTAVVSLITAIALWPLLPKAIALPSPVQLQRANDALQLRIAERDEALRALEHETIERQRTEEMLRQSQKMEAVGNLTGGIAHDFNNHLTVVIANIERAQRFLDSDETRHKCLSQAMIGAENAAKLTDQLLAFSRKQPLNSASHVMNEIVENMMEILQTSLGSRISIDLELQPGLPAVEIDRNQMENAILNLAINARDSMPSGGTLSIATTHRNDSVSLTLRDTGQGMSPEIIDHVFEPFFTTKKVGEGTGLGLSQVYGFVNQSGGNVTIASTVGVGTSVTIMVPTTRKSNNGDVGAGF
ncbi:MAG TPA: ATP-binding protein [Sphingomonas sp.]|nr:ATP-binding protein [Sphingomonas sp.]